MTLLPSASGQPTDTAPVALTSEERAWLHAREPLRYAPHLAAPPFGFLGPGGQVIGVTPDLVAVLERHLDVKIEPVQYASWSEALTALRQGEVDFMAAIVRTQGREQFLEFTRAYHEIPNVLFVNEAGPQFKTVADLTGRRVGAVRDYAAQAWLRDRHPEVVSVPVESTREGLLMLALGQLDGMLTSLPVGHQIIAQNSLNNLRVMPEVLFSSPHCLAVKKGDVRLLAILQKALDQVTDAEWQAILGRWSAPAPPLSEVRIPSWIWQGMAALIALLALFAFWNYSLRKLVARHTRELRESQTLLRHILEAMPVAGAWSNGQGRIEFVNRRFSELFGYTPADIPMVKDWFRQACPGLQAEHHLTLIQPPPDGVPNAPTELTVTCKDGSARIVEAASCNVAGKCIVAFNDLTARKRIEDALAGERNLLRVVTENLPDYIYVKDARGAYLFANQPHLRLFGVTSSESIVGRTVFDFFSSEAARRFHEDDEAVLRSGKPLLHQEEAFVDSNGQRHWLLTTKVPLRDGQGPVRGIVGISRDITERKRAEDALRESEERYRLLFDEGTEGIALAECDSGVILDCNKAFLQITGWDKAELIGQSQKVVHPPEDGSLLTEAFARHSSEAEGQLLEMPLLTKSGEIRTVEVKARALVLGGRRVLQGFFRDVTQRKQAAAALRESEERYRLLFNGMTDGVFVHHIRDDNLPGSFLAVNDALCQRLGYSREEMLNMSVLDIDAPESTVDRQAVVQKLRRGEAVLFEQTHVDRNGRRIPVEVHVQAFPLRGRPVVLAVARDITERKAAEKALLESEAQFRLVWENALDGMRLTDERGVVHRVNEAYCRLVGKPREALEGQLLSAAYAEADREEILTSYRRRFQDRCLLRRLEREMTLWDGREIHIELTNAFLGLPGQPEMVLSVARDITERKRAEEALHQSQANLACAQRIAHLGSWECELGDVENVNANPLRWSDEVFRIFGYAPGEIDVSNENFFRSVHPQDRARIAAAIREAIQQRQQYRFDHRILLPDGSERIVHEQAEVVLDPATGRPLKLVGTVQDITERKRAEEALARSEAELAAIQDHAPVMLCLVDAEMRLHRANRALAEFANRHQRDLPGLRGGDVLDCLGAQHDPRGCGHGPHCPQCMFQRTVRSVIASGTTVSRVEIRPSLARHSSATGIVLLLSCARVQLDGQTFALLCLEDVSHQKRLETQLRQAQKMEAVGQLAGGIAHDFNNILTVILGNAGLLGGIPGLSQDVLDLAGQISDAAQRAANLTRQLLAFSRQQVMQVQRLDLNEVLTHISKMLHRLLGEHIALECLYAPALPAIEADVGMVEQVILNLAINARDAMPKGGRLTIATRSETLGQDASRHNPEARPGRFATLTITDTGSGMDASTLARIFEPFFTTKDVGKGTGLGLATVYGIVKQHDGWIEVASRLDHGTTFRVFFPATEMPLKAAADSEESYAAAAGHETILVVEDENSVRDLVKTSLQRTGYRVLEAAHGLEAIRVWNEQHGRVDLLLTDLVMPEGINGLELAQQLRLSNPELKVIYSSGYSGEFFGGTPDLSAGEYFLPKPYNPLILAQTVRRCLDEPFEG